MKILWHNEKRKISELIPTENNPRILTEKQKKDLEKSINKFDLAEIPAINTNNKILAGHMRLKILQELKGDIEIDVRVPNRELTEKEAGEYLIRSNKNTGEWDMDMLANEWDELELIDFGFDEIDLGMDVAEEEAKEDDYEMPDEIQTDIVKGDLFEIYKNGELRHKLLCGDSTLIDDVKLLMGEEKADVGHNDPPYGMKKEKEGVKNDNLNYDDLLQFNQDWITLQFTFLKNNGSFYCWGTDEPLMDIYSHILKPYIKTQKATFRNLITWDKGSGQGQNSEDFRMYPIADEKCLFVMCGVQDFKFERNESKYNIVFESIRLYFETEKEKSNLKVEELCKIDSTRCSHYWAKSQWEFPTKESYKKLQSYCEQNNIDSFKKEYDELKKEYDELKKEYDELKKEYYSTRAYFNNTHDNQNNVWHFERISNKEREGTGQHATPKPILLCQRVIKSSCPDNGLVIDFFLGSGSTMVACHQLNRRCYGLELSEKYCAVILQRMLKLDKDLKIKRNGIDETEKYFK